jgi:hypothetical protein
MSPKNSIRPELETIAFEHQAVWEAWLGKHHALQSARSP